MVVPFVILAGFILGIITATEAGAVVAGYAFLAAKLYYRNVSWREMGRIAYDSAILTAAVVFLLAVASVYQYLMGVSGVPQLLGQLLSPLKGHPWLFLTVTAIVSCLFGMVLEGLPAAVVLIPVVFPISESMGIDPIHFNIVQTAAVGIGLFLPPMGVGLLMALRFAKLNVERAFPDLPALHVRPVRGSPADHLHPRDQPHTAEACRTDPVGCDLPSTDDTLPRIGAIGRLASPASRTKR